jgi:hypothetical protein
MANGEKRAGPLGWIAAVRPSGRPHGWARRCATGTMAAAAALALAPAAWAEPGSAPSQAGSVESAREITLQSLGLPAQTVFGPASTVAVYFPQPPGPLAGSGCALRISFSYSPLLDPATSSVAISVNGQPVSALPLVPATADGATVDVHVPTPALRDDRPNLFEARFTLRLMGRGSDAPDDPSAFARLENQTLLHYQLYVAPGTPPPPHLDAYPFPLVGTRGGGSARLGLVLPEAPTDVELRSAFRLVADLGRRSQGQDVAADAVTTHQLDWLKAGGVPALMVGVESRLPAAEPVLRAAGFSRGTDGWTPPGGGQAIGPDDGILAAATSPWDRRTPIVLVTGESATGLDRAAAALLRPVAAQGDGAFALVGSTPKAPAAPLRPAAVTFPALADQGARLAGGGRHALSLAFPAPPADRESTGDLELGIGHSPFAPGARAWLAASLNGIALGTVALDARNEREIATHLAVPGSALRPGQNTLTLDAYLPDGDAGQPEARLSSDGRLELPGAPGATGLELLPHPVFDDPAGVGLVVSDAGDALLTAAARIVAALGSRSPATPDLTVLSALQPAGAEHGSLVVIGLDEPAGGAGRIARALGLAVAPPAGATSVVQVLPRPGAGGHHVLWASGAGPAGLEVAGDVLYTGALTGNAARIGGSGRAQNVPPSPAPAGSSLAPSLVNAMIALAAVLLVVGVGWQAWRPREERA